MSKTKMVSSSSSLRRAYCRKQKSLGLLCSNFLNLYNREDTEDIDLGDAAFRLGVERRRIYDIVNVLENVEVLTRKAKNLYSWNGFGSVPKALQDLKEQGFKDIATSQDGSGSHSSKVSNTSSTLKSPLPSKYDIRREKSMSLLSQNFVKLFVCSNAKLISLDDAARLLLGDGHDTSIMRTKVRRLYDIANVLSSINLIEKTHTLDTKKPAFRWLGIGGNYKDESATVSIFNESRKRMFGADLSNISAKKSKVDMGLTNHEDFKIDVKIEKEIKRESLENEHEHGRSSQEQDLKEDVKMYKFGPFAPVGVSKVHNYSENSILKQVNSWETLASTCRPQYHNEALKDLFGHYVEAWKSWYSELDQKKSIH